MFGCQQPAERSKNWPAQRSRTSCKQNRSRCVIRTRRFIRNETAKATLIRFATGMLLLASCGLGVWAQEATATRNLILRRDPSKSSPIIGHVAKGDRLTLLQT